MAPYSEFRLLPVTASEPADRTTAGTVVGDSVSLDLSTIDTTDEPGVIPVRVLWWRITDMDGAGAITNIRLFLSGASNLIGANQWHLDITDTWTVDKTPVQVETGTPGDAPLSIPEANLERMGGGTITGITHDQTSQYIYLSGRIGLNEPAGSKSGLILTVTYNYD